jgi:hypothetical protein
LNLKSVQPVGLHLNLNIYADGVGIFTDQCVASTVRSLADESFDVLVSETREPNQLQPTNCNQPTNESRWTAVFCFKSVFQIIF